MKIVLAIGDENIKEKIKEKYKNQVYDIDFSNKESLIEYIAKSKRDDIVLITKDSLDGNLNGRLYIKHIKLACPNIKIIYFVEHLDMDYKKFLFANEVLNIIENFNIKIDELYELIENNKFIVYKNSDIKEVEKNLLVAVCGTSGSGKSFVASMITKQIAKILQKNTALLDMNLYNPSLDIINNIEVNSNIFGQIVEDVDKSLISGEDIKDYLINDLDDKKVVYLTNNVDLFDVQNKLNIRYYDFVVEKIKNSFKNTVVDLPSFPFLDVVNYTLINASKILFVINPNYISIRQAVKYLDIITNLYNISKDKIGIVVNKITKNSLDNIQLKSLLKGYKIVLNINYEINVESLVNGDVETIKLKNNWENLYKFLEINNKEGRNYNTLIRNFILSSKKCVKV